MMNRLLNFFNRNAQKLRTFSLFAITTVILILLFPREGRFRYEFQKGKPWMHEGYIAPFNFPIYKSEEELAIERDSILREFKPYFKKEITKKDQMLNKFSGSFNRKWEAMVRKQNEELPDSLRVSDSINVHRDFLKSYLAGILGYVYQHGIVENNDILERVANPNNSLVILTDQIAEERKVPDVFTQKTAYEYLVDKIDAVTDTLPYSDYKQFIRSLNLNELLSANLFYDEETSNKVRAEMLNAISLTQGMVQSGELVISRGELVTSEKYRILESLRREYAINLGLSDNLNFITLGKIILVIISMVILYFFLHNFRPDILRSISSLTFLLLLFLIVTTLSSFILRYDFLSIYVLPLAIVPIMVLTFFDSRLALFVHILTVLVIGFWTPNGFEFVYLNIITGIVAIYSLTNSYRRGILALTAVIIFATYTFVYFSFSVIQEGRFSSIDYKPVLWFAGNSFLILSSYPLIFVFEKTFGFLSDSSLLELSDTNQPLLRELAEKAPGTFQHSLQVANLSEAAIHQIGGKPLLIRTGALYHDLGKMIQPQYFIENQQGDFNPHDKLDFGKSAETIISHVRLGMEIARKHNLPELIIDFIRTHHGSTMVQYFYRSFLRTNPQKEADLARFTYPGPKPHSRETAVLMMADSVEASSRSLKVKDADSINYLIDKIIDDQVRQEQFDEADITFRDIKKIKEIFKKKILDIHHFRIEYPEAPGDL